jgi:heme/copper-type cytochrome/quinol oxidase subunit 2
LTKTSSSEEGEDDDPLTATEVAEEDLLLCSVQTLLFCVLQNFVVQAWNHVHSAVDQEEIPTIDDNPTMEEAPTIVPQVPLVILVLILHCW